MRRGWRDIAALAGYAALTVGFFWQPLLAGALVPRGGGDLASFLYPMYHFAATSLQAGVIPFWNPHLYGGSPFAADMQSGLYYPLNLALFLTARPFSFDALMRLDFLHYFLAAVFTYAYLRRLELGRRAAFGGGIVFAFSGFMVAHLGHYNMVAAATYLPLLLFCFHPAVVSGRLRWAAATGVVYGVSALAGHLQITLYLGLFLAVYWLWALAGGGRERRWRRLAALPLACLVAATGTAFFWLPVAELVGLSLRAELTYARATEFSASPLGFVTYFVPHFFGQFAGDYWGIRGSLTESYAYVGLLPLALAPLALLARGQTSAWRWRWFFAAAIVGFLLLSWGESTALYGWVWRLMPGFDKVRAPGRFVLFVDFSLAVLAAYGLQTLGRRLSWRERPPFRALLCGLTLLLAGAALVGVPFLYHAVLTSQDKDAILLRRVVIASDSLVHGVVLLAIVLALLAYYRWGRSFTANRGEGRLLPWLAIALLTFDLFSANAAMNPTDEDLLRHFRHPQVAAFFSAQPGPFRIDSETGVHHLWQPDTSLIYGIDDAMGIFNPVILADYDRYWGALGSRSVAGYDLLNIRYVIAPKDVVLDWTKFTPVLTDAPAVNVFENTHVLPRALVAPRAEVMSREAMLPRLASRAFDARQTVLLEDAAYVGSAGGSARPAEVVAWRRPNPNEVVIEIVAPDGGYLLHSEVFYPGWRAYVDGREAPLRRADYIFQTVQLPPGAHTVQFVFRPRHFEVALALSAATWLALVVLPLGGLAVGRLRRRA